VEERVAALCRSQPAAGPAQEAGESRAPVAPIESAPQAESPGAELDQPALDKLLALVGGEPALLGELIDSFLQDTPPLLEALRRCLDEGNAAGLRQAAHPLKSSSRDFGATRLSEWARELEERGKAGTLEGAAALVALVEAEYPRVKTALEAVRTK